MATFTKTVTWVVNIDGVTNTYTYGYDVTDVVDVQISRNQAYGTFNTPNNLRLSSTPELIFALNTSENTTGRLTTGKDSGGVGDFVHSILMPGQGATIQLADAGGNHNEDVAGTETTLFDADYVRVDPVETLELDTVIAVLHKANS